MDFCRVIALNVCMFGNESNVRFHYVNDYANKEYEIVKSRYNRYEKTKNLVYSMNLLVEKFNMEI